MDKIGSSKQHLFLDGLKNAGIINERVFTVFLGYNSTYTSRETSKIWFGVYFDPTSTNVTWMTVLPFRDHWQVSLGNAVYGSTS